MPVTAGVSIEYVQKIFFVIRLRHYNSILTSQNKYIQSNDLLESLNNKNSVNNKKCKNLRSLKQWNKLYETFDGHLYATLSPELIDLTDVNLMKYLTYNNQVKIHIDSLKDVIKNLTLFDSMYSMLSQIFYKFILPSNCFYYDGKELFFKESKNGESIEKLEKSQKNKKRICRSKSVNPNIVRILPREESVEDLSLVPYDASNGCLKKVREMDIINENLLDEKFIDKTDDLPNLKALGTYSETQLQHYLNKIIIENKTVKKFLLEKSNQVKEIREKWIKSENANRCLQAELKSSQVSLKSKQMKWMEMANTLATPVLINLKRDSTDSQDKHYFEQEILQDELEKCKIKLTQADETIVKLKSEIDSLNKQLLSQNNKYDEVVCQNLALDSKFDDILMSQDEIVIMDDLDIKLELIRKQMACTFSNCPNISTRDISLVEWLNKTPSQIENIIEDGNICQRLKKFLNELSNIESFLIKSNLFNEKPSNLQIESSTQTYDHLIQWALSVENYLLEKDKDKVEKNYGDKLPTSRLKNHSEKYSLSNKRKLKKKILEKRAIKCEPNDQKNYGNVYQKNQGLTNIINETKAMCNRRVSNYNSNFSNNIHSASLSHKNYNNGKSVGLHLMHGLIIQSLRNINSKLFRVKNNTRKNDNQNIINSKKNDGDDELVTGKNNSNHYLNLNDYLNSDKNNISTESIINSISETNQNLSDLFNIYDNPSIQSKSSKNDESLVFGRLEYLLLVMAGIETIKNAIKSVNDDLGKQHQKTQNIEKVINTLTKIDPITDSILNYLSNFEIYEY